MVDRNVYLNNAVSFQFCNTTKIECVRDLLFFSLKAEDIAKIAKYVSAIKNIANQE